MLIYVLNFLSIFLYMVICYQTKNLKLKKFLFILTTIQLILILGLRDIYLGNDMPFYWKYYEMQKQFEISNLSFSRFEIFFKWLTKIITYITYNKNVYLLIISILSITPISIIVYKKSKNPFLSVLLFLAFGFYNFDFSGLRQAIAFSIVFYSYKYIVDKKLFKFILAVICASLFHSSALVFLPAYLLRNIKINKLTIFLIILSYIMIFLFKNQIFTFVNSFFYKEYTMVVTDSYLWMIMCLFITMVSLLFYKQMKLENKSILYSLVAAGSAIMILSPIANNILRIANYYYLFVILLIPEVIKCMKSGRNKFYSTIFAIIFCFIIYVYLLNVDDYNIVPYIFGGI